MNLSDQERQILENSFSDLEKDFLHQLKNSMQNPSLFSGDEGLIIFLIQRQIDSNSTEYAEFISERILQLWHYYSNSHIMSLANGLTGFLFFLRWVKESEYLEINDADIITPLELKLESEIFYETNQDYLHGFAGMLWYFLSFSNNHHFIQKIIEKYLSACKECENRIWWEDMFTQDRINLGLSHGLAGHLIILSKIIEKYPENQSVSRIIKKGVDTLIDEIRITKSGFKYIPDFIEDNNSDIHSLPRVAWCYGDLGRIFALVKCGSIINSAKAIDTSKILLSQFDLIKDSRLRDTMICHGISGVPLVLGAIKEYQLSSPSNFDTYWKKNLIDFALNNEFSIRKFYDIRIDGYKTNSSFLEGSSGVALVLLDILNSRKSNYKHFLLL